MIFGNHVPLAGTYPHSLERVRLNGVVVTADITVHSDEVRRREHGGATIVDSDEIMLLATLPTESFLPAWSMREPEFAILQRLVSKGAVSVEFDSDDSAWVSRVASPPLTVRRVSVTGGPWRSALRSATRFAPYCERRIILSSVPKEWDELQFQARYFGVGVTVRMAGPFSAEAGEQELVAAAPFHPERFTAASWQFAEQAWAQLLLHRNAGNGEGSR